MDNKIIISLVVLFLFIGVMATAKTLNINGQGNMKNDTYEHWDNRINKSAGETVEDLVIIEGIENLQDIAVLEKQEEFHNKCMDVYDTKDLDKLQDGIDDLDMILIG